MNAGKKKARQRQISTRHTMLCEVILLEKMLPILSVPDEIKNSNNMRQC
jgi:hypothetical protein